MRPSVKDFWRNLTEGVEVDSVSLPMRSWLRLESIPRSISNPDYVPASSTFAEPDFFDASFFGFSAGKRRSSIRNKECFLSVHGKPWKMPPAIPVIFPERSVSLPDRA